MPAVNPDFHGGAEQSPVALLIIDMINDLDFAGGPKLLQQALPAAEAIRAGLVDRYIFRVVPAIVGGGTPALPEGARFDLALNTTRRFDDGSVVLDYRLR